MKKFIAILGLSWITVAQTTHATPTITDECEKSLFAIAKKIDQNNWVDKEPFYMGVEQITLTGEISDYNGHMGMAILEVLVRYEKSAYVFEVHPGKNHSKCLVTKISAEYN